jgi:hypothetical protein
MNKGHIFSLTLEWNCKKEREGKSVKKHGIPICVLYYTYGFHWPRVLSCSRTLYGLPGKLVTESRDNSPNQQQRDSILGCQHGCELPPELQKKWPLGIDRIKELWTSNADGRLLAFLCSVAKDYEPGNSLCQYLLLGPRAFHLLRPENVEAVLSTNFKGSRRQYKIKVHPSRLQLAYDV